MTYVEKNIDTDEENRQIRNKRKRKNRIVLWFTPPWNNQVLIGVGKLFFKILDICFANSKLRKLFNRKSVKLGYWTTRIFHQHIAGKINIVLRKSKRSNNTSVSRNCTCQVKTNCPIDSNCNQQNVIHKDDVFVEFGNDEVAAEYYWCTSLLI